MLDELERGSRSGVWINRNGAKVYVKREKVFPLNLLSISTKWYSDLPNFKII
ncbi:MAG: hypothetical protein IPM85_05925 [Chitinophagaceae bacterium]|nr:hypothetical protein [Chitinophagaceae bacterium]